MSFVEAKFGVGQRRACKSLGWGRSSQRYQAKRVSDMVLTDTLKALAQQHLRFGYRRLHAALPPELGRVNHKRVHRLYREAGIQLRKPKKKQRPYKGKNTPPPVATKLHQVWAMDFIRDQLEMGRAYRIFDAIDTYGRQCVQLTVAIHQTARSVRDALDDACRVHGRPQTIICDNGPEFRSKILQAWAERRGIRLHFIDPGRPMQNGYIESFHSRLRDECLSLHTFRTVAAARQTLLAWSRHYNECRPHGALGGKSPAAYHLAYETSLAAVSAARQERLQP